jgi:hypothetical protein
MLSDLLNQISHKGGSQYREPLPVTGRTVRISLRTEPRPGRFQMEGAAHHSRPAPETVVRTAAPGVCFSLNAGC